MSVVQMPHARARTRQHGRGERLGAHPAVIPRRTRSLKAARAALLRAVTFRKVAFSVRASCAASKAALADSGNIRMRPAVRAA